MLTVGILTVSDRGSSGERRDRSGETIRDILSEIDAQVVDYAIVPDEKSLIAEKLTLWADGGNTDVIFTTGGTGLGPRDVTPEATLSVIHRVTPGFAEAMRVKSLVETPRAMLSRAVSGIRGSCLIINLPGSPRAVRECLRVILAVIPHAVETLKGLGGECASPEEAD
jgi:molybdenum cofactor synthesis domain-containing protein